jgi:hypothetical protein
VGALRASLPSPRQQPEFSYIDDLIAGLWRQSNERTVRRIGVRC